MSKKIDDSNANTNESNIRDIIKIVLLSILILMIAFQLFIEYNAACIRGCHTILKAFNSLSVGESCLLATIFLTLVASLVFAYDYIREKSTEDKLMSHVVVPMGYLILTIIVIAANDKWCYLFAMFIVAYNTSIIQEKLLVYIRQIFEKTPHEEQRTSSENEEKEKKDKEEEEKEVEAKDKKINEEAMNKAEKETKKEETNDENNKLFVNRNRTERHAIKYINDKYFTDFQGNLKIEVENSKPLYPDGFQKINNDIYLLDVVISKTDNSAFILDRCKKHTSENIAFFERYYKNYAGHFYQAVLVSNQYSKKEEDNLRAEYRQFIKQWLGKYDFKFFVIKSDELSL